MMPHVHLLLGLSCANILAIFDVEPPFLLLFILGNIIPDIDFIISRFSKYKNHRKLLTHFPSIYLIGSIISFFVSIPIFWVFLGCFLHTLTDIIDFEIYPLAPICAKSYSVIGINYENIASQESFFHFFKAYYKNRKIIAFELVSVLFLILSTIL